MLLNKKLIKDQEKKRFYDYDSFQDRIFIFFANPLSLILYKTGFNAISITLISGFSSIIGGYFLTFENEIVIFAAMIFFIVFYLLDYCDGIVARLRNEQSVGGQYIDSIMHVVTSLSFSTGISVGAVLIDGRKMIPFAILSIIASSLTLSRFSIGWMSIVMKICEDKKQNNNNKKDKRIKFISHNYKILFIVKILRRLGSLIFHEDYFIFSVPVIFFFNILYGKNLQIDIRSILIIYGSLIYFPAMLFDILYFSKGKIDSGYLEFKKNDLNPKLPEFIYFKDD